MQKYLKCPWLRVVSLNLYSWDRIASHIHQFLLLYVSSDTCVPAGFFASWKPSLWSSNWLFHFNHSSLPQKPRQTGSMPTMSLPPQWPGRLRKDRIPASLPSESKNWAELSEIRKQRINFGNQCDRNTSSYPLASLLNVPLGNQFQMSEFVDDSKVSFSWTLLSLWTHNTICAHGDT